MIWCVICRCLLLSKIAQPYLDDQGLYASSLVAGTTDVDAITLSVIHLTEEGPS